MLYMGGLPADTAEASLVEFSASAGVSLVVSSGVAGDRQGGKILVACPVTVLVSCNCSGMAPQMPMLPSSITDFSSVSLHIDRKHLFLACSMQRKRFILLKADLSRWPESPAYDDIQPTETLQCKRTTQLHILQQAYCVRFQVLGTVP